MADTPMGVLVMAYGTPATPDDIESYYTHIRRGRPPTPELLAELRARYEAIGGVSPLLERTRAQAAALQSALGDGFVVQLGMKHAPPFIEDGLAALSGLPEVVGLVLAPHYSRLSVGEYAARTGLRGPNAMAGLRGPNAMTGLRGPNAMTGLRGPNAMAGLTMVESWHLEPGYVDLLARFVKEAGEFDEVVFTAHSLPARILDEGDPYPRQLEETAAAVADRAGVERWSVGWQSAGRTPEPWIGPDILDVLRVRKPGQSVLVCPAGFVSDHLEVLYDLDIEAARLAAELGLRFARTPMPNDHPEFIEALARVVRSAVT